VKSWVGRNQVDGRDRIEGLEEDLVQPGPVGHLIASLDDHGDASLGPCLRVGLDETAAWKFAAVNSAPSCARASEISY
jgi:hypothetical protein